MDLPRIGKKLVDLPLVATLRDGALASVTSVDVGFAPPGGDSASVTTWHAVPVAANKATFLLAGPAAADTIGAIVSPVYGSDLWARIADNPEVDAARIDHIRLT